MDAELGFCKGKHRSLPTSAFAKSTLIFLSILSGSVIRAFERRKTVGGSAHASAQIVIRRLPTDLE
jgi:hypothetical protein